MPYQECPVTYLAMVAWLQRKYTMTPEVPQCIKKLSAENQSKTVSVLLAVIIALTAAVPFLQPGHGKSINLITGGISA